MKLKTLIILASALIVSCSSSGQLSNSTPTPSLEEKPPQEPPKKKPVPQSKCKISNGAGRVFTAIDESREMAETKARHECGIYSRHCVLLDCSTIEEEE